MSGAIAITDKFLGFEVLNAEKAVISGGVEETSYAAVEELNANLRERFEERAKADLRAGYVASEVMAGNSF